MCQTVEHSTLATSGNVWSYTVCQTVENPALATGKTTESASVFALSDQLFVQLGRLPHASPSLLFLPVSLHHLRIAIICLQECLSAGFGSG